MSLRADLDQALRSFRPDRVNLVHAIYAETHAVKSSAKNDFSAPPVCPLDRLGEGAQLGLGVQWDSSLSSLAGQRVTLRHLDEGPEVLGSTRDSSAARSARGWVRDLGSPCRYYLLDLPDGAQQLHRPQGPPRERSSGRPRRDLPRVPLIARAYLDSVEEQAVWDRLESYGRLVPQSFYPGLCDSKTSSSLVSTSGPLFNPPESIADKLQLVLM